MWLQYNTQTTIHYNTTVVITSTRTCNSYTKFHSTIINVWSSRGFGQFRSAYLALSLAQAFSTARIGYVSWYFVGRDSSVGISTRYRLDGPAIESRWERDFPHPSSRHWYPPSLLYNGYRVFPVGKAAGGVALTTNPPSSAEVEGRVELYICSPSGPSWPVLEITLPLPLPFFEELN